jgi:hypothetical protein
MSRSKNTIKASDSTTTPIKLKYSSSFTLANKADYGITTGVGSNGPVTITGSVPESTINYRLFRQLYYQYYLTGSQNFSASYYDWNAQSTACSGSFEFERRYFPTESNKRIAFIACPRSVFGEQFSRNSITITNPGYSNAGVGLSKTFEFIIKDDGNGNLYATGSNAIIQKQKVGNIIYSQGIIIITDSAIQNAGGTSYINCITGSYVTCSYQAETTIYQNQYVCRVNENDFNYTLNPSATISASTGSYIDAVTGSDFRPYATTVGLYNDRDELLVVGKLSTPYPVPPNTDISFVVRYDS